MPLHSSLTDPNLHEPKGAASASQGMIYVADGAGSGTWTYLPTGFGRYQHAGTAQTLTTTPAKLVSDGAGSNSTSAYLPREIRGTGELWDTVTNKITPVDQGDAYTIRFNFPFTAKTGSPTIMTVVVDIGGAAGITIPILTSDISLIKTPPFQLSTTINVDSLDTFLANGGQVFASVDTGTVTISGFTIQITRTHGEV